jgi:hypothetical protein
MARLGSLLVIFFLLSGCLEQELDVLNASEAERLLADGSSKDWISSNTEFKLLFTQTSIQRYLLTNSIEDSLSYGTWSITSDVRGNFTDSLLFDMIGTNVSNPLVEITNIRLLTSEILDLMSDGERLEFSSIEE